MKLSVEVKEDNKVTTYTANLDPAAKAAKSVAEQVGKFLKDTFQKETFTKETKQKTK